MMTDDDRELVDIFMQAQAKPVGQLFSENVLAGIKAVLDHYVMTASEGYRVARRAEVRLNDDKTLDEVVTKDGDQLEQMDYNHWFLQIADVAVWLHSKNAIRASYEHRSSAALDSEGKK